MLKEMKKYWEMGYKFVRCDDLGEGVEDDWEEVVYDYETCEEDNYIDFSFEVEEEEKTVYYRVTCDE